MSYKKPSVDVFNRDAASNLGYLYTKTAKLSSRLATEVIIHEPNGNNLGLKIIEKASPYHREHAEKSYFPGQIKRWIEKAGGRVTRCRFAGFVPMFCPTWLARVTKAIEPLVETVPLLNSLGCTVFVVVGERRN